MKLTKQKLKSLIKEVVVGKRKDSMILWESMEMGSDEEAALPTSPTFERIMDVLEGRDPSASTVVIMSGQNPMAAETDSAENASLAERLKKDIAKMGLEYIPIGGRFEGHDERSVIILNASREQAQQLNRMYKQWGYVWGQDMPNFEMIKIDHTQPQGEARAPGSKVATGIEAGAQAQAATDNYSFDISSGRKFIISLY